MGMAEAIPTIIHNQTEIKASVFDSFRHAETGILADINFVEHLFRPLAGEQQRPEDGGEEAERDRDDAWVFQFQDRLAEPHDGFAVFTQYINLGFVKRLLV